MNENSLSNYIIGAAIEVHKQLGPGLLESAYEECLAYEFAKGGLKFERQKKLPITYKEIRLDCSFRLDFLVHSLVIVELKTVDSLMPTHTSQLLTYLRLTQCKLGLLINFNVPKLCQGIKRIALNL